MFMNLNLKQFPLVLIVVVALALTIPESGEINSVIAPAYADGGGGGWERPKPAKKKKAVKKRVRKKATKRVRNKQGVRKRRPVKKKVAVKKRPQKKTPKAEAPENKQVKIRSYEQRALELLDIWWPDYATRIRRAYDIDRRTARRTSLKILKELKRLVKQSEKLNRMGLSSQRQTNRGELAILVIEVLLQREKVSILDSLELDHMVELDKLKTRKAAALKMLESSPKSTDKSADKRKIDPSKPTDTKAKKPKMAGPKIVNGTTKPVPVKSDKLMYIDGRDHLAQFYGVKFEYDPLSAVHYRLLAEIGLNLGSDIEKELEVLLRKSETKDWEAIIDRTARSYYRRYNDFSTEFIIHRWRAQDAMNKLKSYAEKVKSVSDRKTSTRFRFRLKKYNQFELKMIYRTDDMGWYRRYETGFKPKKWALSGVENFKLPEKTLVLSDVEERALRGVDKLVPVYGHWLRLALAGVSKSETEQVLAITAVSIYTDMVVAIQIGTIDNVQKFADLFNLLSAWFQYVEGESNRLDELVKGAAFDAKPAPAGSNAPTGAQNGCGCPPK